MLRIDTIKISPDGGMAALTQEIARLLKIREKDILGVQVVRKSIDARKDVVLVYSVEVEVSDEKKILQRIHRQNIRLVSRKKSYTPPTPLPTPDIRPVVVGAGPAGLFATLILAQAGLCPMLIERGQPVEQRQKDVEHFWKTGILDPRSNVQFGEGGAGAFSDGKLNTGTKNIRHRWIMEQLVACGAPEDILIDAKPHIGTDKLHIALINLRKKLISLGATIRFGCQLTHIEISQGAVSAITVTENDKTERFLCEQLILAPGHSARDTFTLLHQLGVSMEPKPFAVGVRIEHKQSAMDATQYKKYASHPGLPASTYKLACHLPNDRSAFSFCVCPGGEVVAAASEPGRVVTNGMSEFARNQENINGALLVNVTPEDFPDDGPLAGITFQRQLEESAFHLGGEDFSAPCQRVGDFLAGRPSTGAGTVQPSYRPGVTYTDLHHCLPDFVATSIANALPLLDTKLHGYASPDALLTAVESRSSSPVRILRGPDGQSPLRGLYPCGEGAGYAGGILSAAADGCQISEKICRLMRGDTDES